MATKKSSQSTNSTARKTSSAQSDATSRTSSSGAATPTSQSGISGSDNLMYSSASNGKSAGKKSSQKGKKTLETLFEDVLRDAYSAEKQLVKALPELVKAAYSEDLQDAFENHLHQTKKHVERLDKVFDKLRIAHEENTCEAMQGLIKETREILNEYEEGPVRDSALIIHAQKVEHYEIATYGSLCELADVLGWQKICDILGRTLDEEEETDQLLTDIAVQINDEAYEMSDAEVEEYR